MSDSAVPSGPFSTTTAPAAEAVPQQNSQPDVAVPKQDDKFASKFAALTRKEKEVKMREKAAADKEAEALRKYSEYEEKSKSEKALLAEMNENPLKFMKKHNITFEQLAEMQLNDENPTADMKIKRLEETVTSRLESKIAELEKRLADKDKSAEERTAQEKAEAAKAAQQDYVNELTEFVNKNEEKYELIKNRDAVQLIYDTVEAYYNETGQILDMDKAADAVEAHLEDEVKQTLELKKFKGVVPNQAKPVPKGTAPTLSNTLAAEVPVQGDKLLSREESLKRAAAMLRFS